MSEALHILLPVHNRRETTVEFVSQLTRQTRPGFHLVLIDDGSTDGTAEAVRALWPEVRVVRGDGNLWWAGALEQGCRELARRGVRDDDLLLLINDDVQIGPTFLGEACRELAESPHTLLLARQVDRDTGEEVDFGGGVRVDLKRLRFTAARPDEEIDCLPTRGLFLRWGDLQRAGGFRPELLPHYLSDYEFTLRAKRAGLALRIARRAQLALHTGQTGVSLANLFTRPRSERFRLLFSQRFKDNPLTWSRFARLVSPAAAQPYLLGRIWAHFALVVLRCAVQRVKPHAAE